MSLKVELALKCPTLSDILSNLFANLLNPNADSFQSHLQVPHFRVWYHLQKHLFDIGGKLYIKVTNQV